MNAEGFFFCGINESIALSINNRFIFQFEHSVLGASEFNLDNIVIFPNPVKSSVQIVNPTSDNLQWLELYDISGRKVKKVNLQEMNREISVDISGLAAANYILAIQGE